MSDIAIYAHYAGKAPSMSETVTQALPQDLVAGGRVEIT